MHRAARRSARDEIATRYGVPVTRRQRRRPREQADIVVLSVKPQTMDHLLDEIAPAIDHRKLVISIAAGVSIAAIARKLGAGVRIVRTMPNTPALVGAGRDRARARRARDRGGPRAGAGALRRGRHRPSSWRSTHLDAVTGLSGSGPAFVFLVIEALADGGVKVGLARPVAHGARRPDRARLGEARHRDRRAPRAGSRIR